VDIFQQQKKKKKKSVQDLLFLLLSSYLFAFLFFFFFFFFFSLSFPHLYPCPLMLVILGKFCNNSVSEIKIGRKTSNLILASSLPRRTAPYKFTPTVQDSAVSRSQDFKRVRMLQLMHSRQVTLSLFLRNI